MAQSAGESRSRTAAPRLTTAQILADLTTLNIADHAAATILITAHAPLLPSHTPRRISPFSRPLSIPDAPHIVRQKSDLSTTKSVLETPANSPGLLEGATGILDGEDEDMNRAKELLRLHGMRAQLDGGGAGGLVSDARRTVDEIERRYRKRLDNAFRH